jgi:phospholipase C
MSKKYFPLLLALLLCLTNCNNRPQKLPDVSHIVVLILENRNYNQIMKTDDAPNIKMLAYEPQSVLFTQSYGVWHMSEPNYLALYCGDTCNLSNDNIPKGNPFKTPNLGRQLIDSGYSFAIYSEDLPGVGSNDSISAKGKYARKHNPVANWMGTDTNQVPDTINQPFTAFPSWDSSFSPSRFATLPTVCFVVPNLNHDMHDRGPDSADEWYVRYIEPYRAWAAQNNSLLIVTFDEDDYNLDNRIATIFAGPMLKHGEDDEHITHYAVLRTIEDIYHLPHIGNAKKVNTINNCWK